MTWLDEERSRRDTLAADVAELRQEMQVGFARLGADVTAQIHALDKRVLDTKADLMKWSLVFWVGAVGAIAALAGVLR